MEPALMEASLPGFVSSADPQPRPVKSTIIDNDP